MPLHPIFDEIVKAHFPALAVPNTYRGWEIRPCEWMGWRAVGPNYDASYEGPEDGWVDNGEKADGRTLEAVKGEIDAWFADHGYRVCDDCDFTTTEPEIGTCPECKGCVA